MSKFYSFNQGYSESKTRVGALLTAVTTGKGLPNVHGNESLIDIAGMINGLEGLNQNETINTNFTQRVAGNMALRSVQDPAAFKKALRDAAKDATPGLANIKGFEAFDHQLEDGSFERQQAATLELNVKANCQLAGAEEMFPTIIIPRNTSTIELPVEVAGVGTYDVGGNAYDQYENMRPVASIISDSTYSGGNDLKLVPVLNDENKEFFVENDVWPSWTADYQDNDLLSREDHQTNFLRPVVIEQFMNLMRAPGQERFQYDDGIDMGSVKVTELLFKIKTSAGEGIYKLNTRSFSGNSLRPVSGQGAVDVRKLKLYEQGIPVTQLFDKEGKDATALFAGIGADYTATIQFQFELELRRGVWRLVPTVVQSVPIRHVLDKNNKQLVIGGSKTPKEVTELVRNVKADITIVGLRTEQKHNNVNHSRYGQTVVFKLLEKSYGVELQQPVSVRYPMDDIDNNGEVLSKTIKQMQTIIVANMTHDAFRAANEHLNLLVANNGKRIFNISDSSNSALPGQYFLTTVGIDDEFELAPRVSTLESKNTLENVRAVVVNRISDAINTLRTKSDVAALKEIDGRHEEYVIVAHAALAPYMLTTGDFRTFGDTIKFSVVETNVSSEIGNFWIFPKSTTGNGKIDQFGGLGVCVSRELTVIEGDVRMDSRQYRMMISQPAYKHWGVGCVAARVKITDIMDLLSGDGLLANINEQRNRVKLEDTDTTTDKEVDIEPGTDGQ